MIAIIILLIINNIEEQGRYKFSQSDEKMVNKFSTPFYNNNKLV